MMSSKPASGGNGLLLGAARVFVLLAIPGLIAWATGWPFIFPSLGPSAFALVTDTEASTGRRVIGGHLIGIVAGWAAYYSIASSVSLIALPEQWSAGMLRLALSGAVSVTITTVVMLAVGAVHSPACATTLIVSLGLLPRISEGVVMMLAILIMFAIHKIVCRWAFSPSST